MSGSVSAPPPPAAPAIDVGPAIGMMKEMFEQAIKANAEISKVQTEGNNAQRAAKGVPNG